MNIIINDAAKFQHSVFRVIARTQDNPEVQLAATAIALVAMCEGTGTNMRELIEASERRCRDMDGPFYPTLRAIREYAKNELRRPIP